MLHKKRYGQAGKCLEEGRMIRAALPGEAERAGGIQPGEGKAEGDFIAMDQYTKVGCQEHEDYLCTRSPMEETGGDGDKVLMGRFLLDCRRKCFPLSIARDWNHLPRTVVESSVLGSLKAQPDRVLGQLLLTTPTLRQAGTEDPWVPSCLVL